jgi:hypothetical protein
MFFVKFLFAILPVTNEEDFVDVDDVAADATERRLSTDFLLFCPWCKGVDLGEVTLLWFSGDFGDEVEDFFMSNCCFFAAARLFTMVDNEVLVPLAPFLITGLC